MKIGIVFPFCAHEFDITKRFIEKVCLYSTYHHIELIGVGIQPESSAISYFNTVSRCRIIRLSYRAGLRSAWDVGANSLSYDLDYVILCHNDIIPSKHWLDRLEPPLANRYFIPYSNHFDDEKAYPIDVHTSMTDGFCIILPNVMLKRIFPVSTALAQFNVDKYLFRTMQRMGMTGYKLAGCFVHHQQRLSKSQDEHWIKVKSEDDKAYKQICGL